MTKRLFSLNTILLYFALAVSCHAQTAHTVTLNWIAPTAQAGVTVTGYNIYRSTTSGQFSATPYASVNSPALTFVDGTLAAPTVVNGSTYFYVVTAKVTYDATHTGPAETEKSNQATAVIPPNPIVVVPNAPGSLTTIVN